MRHNQCLEQIQHNTASVQAMSSAVCPSHSSDRLLPPQSAVRGIGRELAVELVAETDQLLTLCDTVPTTKETIPGCESASQIVSPAS